MAKFFLRKKAGTRIVSGHPWVYANEIGDTDGGYEPGDIVELFSYTGSFIGKGFVNPASQIRIRLLTRQKDTEINEKFFFRKIEQAWKYRQKIGYTENCRVVYGESDGLPGLVIDKYGSCIVVQSQSLGIDRWMTGITSAIISIFSPEGVYLRNDIPIRTLENVSMDKGFLSAPFDTNIVIKENGLQFHVDIANGLKTGYRLDYHENRSLLEHIAKDADVLDVFCYSGSYGLHAAKYGAKTVLGIDNDENAIALAKKNAVLNKLESICSFTKLNAFDALKTWSREGKKYDIVILDPPSFAGNKSGQQTAVAGYKEINLRAMKLLRQGGFLLTSSGSPSITEDTFKEVLRSAAKDAGVNIRQVYQQTQSPDHPIAWAIPTTHYMDVYLLQIL